MMTIKKIIFPLQDTNRGIDHVDNSDKDVGAFGCVCLKTQGRKRFSELFVFRRQKQLWGRAGVG